MNAVTACLTLTLNLVLLMTLTLPVLTSGAYIPRALKRQDTGYGDLSRAEIAAMALSRHQHVPGEGQGPNLFDLLITALRDPGTADEGLKRGKQFKAKPCYWSLVSCY